MLSDLTMEYWTLVRMLASVRDKGSYDKSCL